MRRRNLLLCAMLITWWCCIVLAMLQSYYVRDPYNPALSGTERYGHNGPGGVPWVVMFIELSVTSLVLRPWNYSSVHWRRAGLAMVVWLPWLGLSIMATMHAGPVIALHAAGAFVMVMMLAAVLVRSLLHVYAR